MGRCLMNLEMEGAVPGTMQKGRNASRNLAGPQFAMLGQGSCAAELCCVAMLSPRQSSSLALL